MVLGLSSERFRQYVLTCLVFSIPWFLLGIVFLVKGRFEGDVFLFFPLLATGFPWTLFGFLLDGLGLIPGAGSSGLTQALFAFIAIFVPSYINLYILFLIYDVSHKNSKAVKAGPKSSIKVDLRSPSSWKLLFIHPKLFFRNTQDNVIIPLTISLLLCVTSGLVIGYTDAGPLAKANPFSYGLRLASLQVSNMLLTAFFLHILITFYSNQGLRQTLQAVTYAHIPYLLIYSIPYINSISFLKLPLFVYLVFLITFGLISCHDISEDNALFVGLCTFFVAAFIAWGGGMIIGILRSVVGI